MRLTLVIPIYKEHRRLADALRQVSAFMTETREVDVDVVYVDDGSPDDCASVINALIEAREDPNIRLLRYAVNRGKGFAVKTGVAAATGTADARRAAHNAAAAPASEAPAKPKRAAKAWWASVSSLARRSCGSSMPAACAKAGAIVRQGPHHGAQKSTSTGISLRPT